MSNGTSTTIAPVKLALQTGMPPIYHSRSKELAYDALINNQNFKFNRFGPQLLSLTRPEKRW